MTLMGKLICNNIHNAIGFKTVIADSKANQCITRNFKKEHSKIRQLGGGGAGGTKHKTPKQKKPTTPNSPQKCNPKSKMPTSSQKAVQNHEDTQVTSVL